MKLLAFALIAAVAGSSLAYDFCTPCCTVVGYIQSEQKREEPAEQTALDAACTKLIHAEHLPDFLIKVCDSAVNYALKDLTNEFDSMSDTAICRKVGICSSSESCPSRVPQAFAAKQGGLCQACTIVKNAIDNGKVQQVCSFLEGILPQAKQLCDDIINNKATEDQILAECEKLLCSSDAGAAADPSQCATIAKIEAAISQLPQLCQEAGLGHLCEAVKQLVAVLDHELNNMAQKLHCSSIASAVLPPLKLNTNPSPCAIVKAVQEAVDEIPALCKEIEPNNPVCKTIDSIVTVVDGVLREIEGVLCQGDVQGFLMRMASVNVCQLIQTLEGTVTTLDNFCKNNPSTEGCAQLESVAPQIMAGLQYLQNMLCSGSGPVTFVDILADMNICTACHDIDDIIKSGELDNLCQEANLGQTCQLLKQAEAAVERVLPIVESLAHCSGARDNSNPDMCADLKDIEAFMESPEFVEICIKGKLSKDACLKFQQIAVEYVKTQMKNENCAA